MRILVTGGTGFLGKRLIALLARDGHELLALTRSQASHDGLRALGAEPVVGDLDDPAPLRLPQIDAVVHAAALFRFSGPRAPFFRTNVEGTAALLEAGEGAGAKTFVYISAAGVVMDEAGAPIRNVEEDAVTFPRHFSAYLASKAQAEAIVLAADRPGFRAMALRPPAIWGAGDAFSRELPRAIAIGQFAFVDRGDFPFSTCHVDNVVEAVACALERGGGGRAYFVNDREKTTLREFIAGIAAVHGLSIDEVRSLPYWLAVSMGRLIEWFWAVSRREGDPPVSRAMMRMLGREFDTDDTAARCELGYVGRTTFSEGLRGYAASPTATMVAAA